MMCFLRAAYPDPVRLGKESKSSFFNEGEAYQPIL